MATQACYITRARNYIGLILQELDRADTATTADTRYLHLIEAAKLYQQLGGVFAEIILPSAAFNPDCEEHKG